MYQFLYRTPRTMPLTFHRLCMVGYGRLHVVHLYEECPQHHGHKGGPGVTPETCGAIGKRDQVILMWVKAPGV
jgi:hypothetical protein